MLPLRPAALFRSRRAALVWAAGVLWFAVDVAGGGKPAPDGNGSDGGNAAAADPDALQADLRAFDTIR